MCVCAPQLPRTFPRKGLRRNIRTSGKKLQRQNDDEKIKKSFFIYGSGVAQIALACWILQTNLGVGSHQHLARGQVPPPLPKRGGRARAEHFFLNIIRYSFFIHLNHHSNNSLPFLKSRYTLPCAVFVSYALQQLSRYISTISGYAFNSRSNCHFDEYGHNTQPTRL